MDREQNRIPMQIAPGKKINLSPGEHSELIRAIVEEFGPRFAPGSLLVYAGDTGDKWGYFDAVLLAKLGLDVDSHGKMPDVVLYFAEKNWLLLIESVTSHGPVDGKRHAELTKLFAGSTAGLQSGCSPLRSRIRYPAPARRPARSGSEQPRTDRGRHPSCRTGARAAWLQDLPGSRCDR